MHSVRTTTVGHSVLLFTFDDYVFVKSSITCVSTNKIFTGRDVLVPNVACIDSPLCMMSIADEKTFLRSTDIDYSRLINAFLQRNEPVS